MTTHNLSEWSWSLTGWRPFVWRVALTSSEEWGSKPDVGPVDGRVPGSVQQALLEAGIIPDWNAGVRSRESEWVEHRHWIFSAAVPEGIVEPGDTALLDAQGLDHSGWIFVDGTEVARFQGSLIPHRIQLPERLSDGGKHTLHIVFEEPPREQGQFGYTSKSRHYKSRFNYSWDWCPRIVPMGVWDSLSLQTGVSGLLSVTKARAILDDDFETGRIEVSVEIEAQPETLGVETVSISLRDDGRELGKASIPVAAGKNSLAINDLRVEPWWPNGHGGQKLYEIHISAENASGECLWRDCRRVGFRHVEWKACEGAPEGAEPWLCVVNGKPIFLQGVNWVPPRALYADTSESEYARLIDLYREMGCTCLRVWGGAILEKKVFYDLCDEAGILVWQEFPLSSSGLENAPPDDVGAIGQLCEIAKTYIRRRAHHACLLLWSGGNELTVKVEGEERPADSSHPCLSALRDLVKKEDPEHRFIPTSPSGPVFYAHAEMYGKGVHHDVHGPWGMGSFKDFDAWREYWRGDDALFRSEVGMPGAANLACIDAFCDGMQVVPAEGEYWLHTAAWWTQWGLFKEKVAEGDIAGYVALTQNFQAEAYEIAAAACKGRFPKCGGFIIWMGHDCFPCPANNSVIDFLREPKPAYDALKRVFRGQK